MADDRVPGHGNDDDEQGQEHFTIAQSNALVPMLVLFGLVVLVIFGFNLRRRPIALPEGSAATKAYGPAQFEEVFGTDEALVGLDSVDGGKHALYPVPSPPFSADAFPCMDCHETIDPDPTRRKLVDAHDEIELKHDEEHRWCLDCHDAKNRNLLRLASGETVEFTESYRLCGQCHGTQYRDWRTGIHGKRTGYWNGAKRYLLCVHCHVPHQPHFKALEPLPPPVRPHFLSPHGPTVAATQDVKPAAPAAHHAPDTQGAAP